MKAKAKHKHPKAIKLYKTKSKPILVYAIHRGKRNYIGLFAGEAE